VKDHYILLIKFLDEDLINVEIKNEHNDFDTLLSTLLTIFINSLPFILNLGWINGLAVVITTCLNAFISHITRYNVYRNITYINLILAFILIE
jgi:hypothetical protein